MSHVGETDFDQLTRSLTENFNVLADEVQALSDRKTVLEHKLRFAHEQYQILADKYAPPTDQDVASTLATLQLRPDLQRAPNGERAPLVPLPSRLSGNSKQATAEAIRDGRRASQLLASLKGWTRLSDDSNRSASIASRSSKNRISRRGTSSFTTFYEQDFTVPGKKSQLLCPFVQKSNHLRRTQSGSNAGSIMVTDQTASAPDMEDNTPHHSADPICAALYAETHVSAAPSTAGSNKCPIRFLESHSPEDIAKYFETHKHEIPRSHEICVKRYGRNEVDVRKLDAKYGGNLVNMLQGLGQKHQPMLPKDEELEEYEQEKSNGRVEIWAKNVSQDGLDPADPGEAATSLAEADDEERESRFDRQMKEVRVGESPSRPWGISVPWNQPEVVNYGEDETPNSPPAPVSVPNFAPITRPAGVCPFGHGAPKKEQVEVKQEEDVEDPEDAKSTAAMENSSPTRARPAGKCPFSQEARETFGHAKPEVPLDIPITQYSATYQPRYDALPKSETLPAASETHATQTEPYPPHQPSRDNNQPSQQPAFLAHPQPQTQSTNSGATVVPQMVFNGPVFIGYPVDQAMALMQRWQAGMNYTQR